MTSSIDMSKLVKGSGVLYTTYNDINYGKVDLIIFISTIKYIKQERGYLILQIPKIHQSYTLYNLTEVEKQLLIDFIIEERKVNNTVRPSQTASILKHAGFA